MRITEQVIQTETVIAGLLKESRGWLVWHDDRSKRDHQPNFLAIHMPSRLLVAVFPRPRHMSPSQLPDTSWLPGDWLPVLWYPAMAPLIRSWLAAPQVIDPPGLFTRVPREKP